MSQSQSSYKPSPLSFNSPRTSPFRRPESPSPSTTIRASTPTYQSTRPTTPSKLANASTPSTDTTFAQRATREPLSSPTRKGSSSIEIGPNIMIGDHSVATESASSPGRTPYQPATTSISSSATERQPTTNLDTLSKLPPAQAREMREAFQILDRDNDGLVDRDDVSEMLTSLGIAPTPSQTAAYFPPLTSHPISLPAYLSALSSLLAPLSPPNELFAALSAFDDDDSGQLDAEELIDAVTNSRPSNGARNMSRREVETVMEGYVGKRAFGGKGTSKGDVFRYREWVAGLGAVGDGAKAGT